MKIWRTRNTETMSVGLTAQPAALPVLFADSLQFSRLPMSGLDSTWVNEFAKSLPNHLELFICILNVIK